MQEQVRDELYYWWGRLAKCSQSLLGWSKHWKLSCCTFVRTGKSQNTPQTCQVFIHLPEWSVPDLNYMITIYLHVLQCKHTAVIGHWKLWMCGKRRKVVYLHVWLVCVHVCVCMCMVCVCMCVCVCMRACLCQHNGHLHLNSQNFICKTVFVKCDLQLYNFGMLTTFELFPSLIHKLNTTFCRIEQLWNSVHTLQMALFPGPTQLSVLQVMKSWMIPGNETTRTHSNY